MTINNGNYHFHYKTDIIEQKINKIFTVSVDCSITFMKYE